MGVVGKDPIPQATSPLATWFSYLEHLHSKTIDLGLTRTSEVVEQMDIVKPASFVFAVAGTNGKDTICHTPETVLVTADYKVRVYSSPHLVRYTERVRIQGVELPETTHAASFAEVEAARGDISPTYFEYDTLSTLWLFKQAQLDVVIFRVGLDDRLDITDIADADVAAVTSIALDRTDWLGPDRESIDRGEAGVFHASKPAVVGEPDMPHTIAGVASEKDALLQRRGVDWYYEVEDKTWSFHDTAGASGHLPLPQVPLPNAATAMVTLRASGLAVDDAILHDGIRDATLPGRFQIIGDAPRVILDVAHNPHAAAYLAGRLKTLVKTGCVLVVIGMLHDKDITGTLTSLAPNVDAWYCTPLEGPHGATAGQLVEYLHGGTVCTSVAQTQHAAMTGAKVEDTVLVCSPFHAVAQIMEKVDAGRVSGG